VGLSDVLQLNLHGAGVSRIDTDAPNSERFYGNVNSFIQKVDLSGKVQVRFTARVDTASASANTPVIRLKYFTAFSTTVGDYLQIGSVAEVDLSLAATGYIDSNWVSLAALARVDNTLLALVMFTLLMGCVSKPPVVPDLEYRQIPEGYLQECALPPVPLDTGDLSEAFVQAYQCGEQGNRDKQRIKELTETSQ